MHYTSPVAPAACDPPRAQLSHLVGRAASSVAMDTLGTVCLVGLSVQGPLGLDVPLFLVRTAAMNAAYPTQRAILMDAVPPSARGFWSSLENVTSFTWTVRTGVGRCTRAS